MHGARVVYLDAYVVVVCPRRQTMLVLLLACTVALDPNAFTKTATVTESCPPPESEPPTDTGEPCELFTWFEDCDGDGFGAYTVGAYPPIACDGEQPPVSDPSRCVWRTEAGDCDDTTNGMHPINSELCDNRDNDCDSYVDEDVPC